MALPEVPGATFSGLVISFCQPAVCPVAANATAKHPGPDLTTVPWNAMRRYLFFSRGSGRRKSTTLTSIPTGNPRSEQKSAPPAEMFTVLSKNVLFPVCLAAGLTAAGRSRVSRLCFLTDNPAAGANDAAPSRQDRVPSPSCMQAIAALCTLSAADIRGNTDRIRNFYGKGPVVGLQGRV